MGHNAKLMAVEGVEHAVVVAEATHGKLSEETMKHHALLAQLHRALGRFSLWYRALASVASCAEMQHGAHHPKAAAAKKRAEQAKKRAQEGQRGKRRGGGRVAGAPVV